MKDKLKAIEKRGIRIQTLNVSLFLLTLVLACFLVYSNWGLQRQYERLERAQREYVSCENAAQMFQESIESLDENVQFFAQTGDRNYMIQYFKELMSKKREQAIEVLESDRRENAILAQAKSESDSVIEMDYHIIRLVAVARTASSGVEVTPEYENFSLPEEERTLSNTKKWELAKKMLLNDAYMRLQRDTRSHIKTYSRKVLQRRQTEIEEYEAKVSRHIYRQYIVIILFIACMLIIAMQYYVQVAKVLRNYKQKIVDDLPLQPDGVQELRYLADAYNENAEKKKEQERKLKIRADYDALTGVVNRGAFEKLVESRLQEEDVACFGAFLLIDVDKFKTINDSYGHDVGDAVLKKVAGTLREKFRGDDVVGRLGGDEFALWLEGLPKENISYVTERINEINRELMKPKDGLPKISLSVGVSFALLGENFQQIYKKSDDALYMVKKNGRCGAAVYKDAGF